jgi:hypothetical protein
LQTTLFATTSFDIFQLPPIHLFTYLGISTMNFKSILVVGLSFATLGLSLPAHADTATVISNDQSAIITGNRNSTYQNNTTDVSNSQTGRRTTSNTGTSISNGQAVDVQGNRNTTIQNNGTTVNNTIRRTR